MDVLRSFDRPMLLAAVTSLGILAIPLALLVSVLILGLFRRRVVRSMALAVGARTTEPDPAPANATPARPPLALAMTRTESDVVPGPALAAATRAARRSAAVVLGAGVLQAALATGIYYRLVFAERAPTSPAYATTVLLVVFATPVVLAMAQVTLGTQRHLVGATLAWLGLVALLGRWLGGSRVLLELWAFFAGIPTLVVLLLAGRRLRAVAPLVLACTWILLGALAGGFFWTAARALDELGVHFVDPALTGRPALDAGQVVLRQLAEGSAAERAARLRAFLDHPRSLLDADHPERATAWYLVHVHARWLAPVGVAALLVWALVRWYGVRYRARRASEQMLALETLTLLFTLAWAALASFASPWGWTFLLTFVAYQVTLTLGLRLTMRPPAAASPLLLLRVFRSGRAAEDLLDALGARWRRLGPIRLIAGPDLAQASLEPHEFYDFVSGRLSRQFIQDGRDVEARLAERRPSADPDGLFRVEDFFCHQDTWQPAVSRLMHESDAILMDLRGFSPTSRGCQVEIELLVHTVPLGRIVLLADRTTDLGLLETTAQAAWARLPADSPNAAEPAPVLRVFLAGSRRRRTVRRLLAALAALGRERPAR